MSGPSSPTGALPPETAERVHAYLAAFLSPPAADEAYDEVAEDVAFWGDLDPVQVFAAAHRALGSRLRIAPEVEVLVLAEDADVSVDEISRILEIAPGEVRAMLDEALAELAEPDEVPPLRESRRETPEVPASRDPAPRSTSDDGPTSDWPPALVADDPEPEPEPEPEPARPEPRPVPAASAPAEVEPTVAPTTELPEVRDTSTPDTAAIVTPAETESGKALRDATSRVKDDLAEPAAASPSETRTAPPRRWVLALLVLGSILLIGIIIASLSGEAADPETAGIESGCQDAPVCVTRAVLTDTVNDQGVPGDPRDRFSLDDDVKLWFSFDRNREGPVTLEVRWFRDTNELYRSDFRLAAVDRISLTLAGLFMEQTGQYRVEVVGDGQVLLERSFVVTESSAS